MPVVLWIVPLLLAWYEYFSRGADGFLLVALVIATAIFVFRLRDSWKQTFAANNVVAAADVFLQMSGEERRRVHDHAIEIIRRCGWSSPNAPDFSLPVVRFGWYALAMAELGAPPRLFDTWSLVRNPFFAIASTSRELRAALYIAEKKGFNSTLESIADKASELDNSIKL
jgi:hypothetical protein